MPRRIFNRIRSHKKPHLAPTTHQKTAQATIESLTSDRPRITEGGGVVLPGSRIDTHEYPPFKVDITFDQKTRLKELKKRAKNKGLEFTYSLYKHDPYTKVLDITFKGVGDKDSVWHQISLRPDRAMHTINGEAIRVHDVDPSQRKETIDFFQGSVNRALTHASSSLPAPEKKKPKESKKKPPKSPQEVSVALARMGHMRNK